MHPAKPTGLARKRILTAAFMLRDYPKTIERIATST